MPGTATLRNPIPIHQHLQHAKVYQLRLQRREVLALPGDQRGAQITGIDSILWITQDGDLDDHVLLPGQTFRITLPGQVVVQGMRRP